MNAKAILLVGTGGALGSVLRYMCSWFINHQHSSSFPWGTFWVNITGCFIIGLIFGIASKSGQTGADWVLFFATGLCGGFTTFSAFSLENIQLIRNNNWAVALSYTGGSILSGLLATYAGIQIMKLF